MTASPHVTENMPEIIDVDAKYRGWCTLYLANVRLADGRVITRAIEDHGNAACVLPYDPVRRVALMIRQLRPPTLYAGGVAVLLEAPAGLIDPGEDGATAAQREAMEEVGVRLSTLEPVAELWTMPGVSTERMALFLGVYAQADQIAAGGGVDGENEEIEVLEMPLAELATMADQGRLTDLKTFSLVQTLRLRRPELL
jgi:nudix-type nucleoside diphosphatase (YffH/AdpP family)